MTDLYQLLSNLATNLEKRAGYDKHCGEAGVAAAIRDELEYYRPEEGNRRSAEIGRELGGVPMSEMLKGRLEEKAEYRKGVDDSLRVFEEYLSGHLTPQETMDAILLLKWNKND